MLRSILHCDMNNFYASVECILRPEFRHANHQLMLCTGGFGAQANARGRTCCCISLYDGRKTSFYRTDFLGVMEEKKLPEWAQKGLEKAKERHGCMSTV